MTSENAVFKHVACHKYEGFPIHKLKLGNTVNWPSCGTIGNDIYDKTLEVTSYVVACQRCISRAK